MMTDIEVKQAKDELINIAPAVIKDCKQKVASGVKTKSDLIDIIDKLFPANTKYTPSMLNEVEGRIINANIDINFVNEGKPSAAAFVFKQGRGEFGMFIHPDNEKSAYNYLKLHEYGHILFNHCTGIRFHKQQFATILSRNFSRVEKFFTKNAIKIYDKEKLVDFLYHKFANIAQDMEINSKLFQNEWLIAAHTIRRSQLLIYVDKKEQRPLIVKEINAKLNNKKSTMEFCHPSVHKWPEEMDWLVYMQYILNNIEKFLEMEQQSGQGGEGQSQDSGLISEKEIEAQSAAQGEQKKIEEKQGAVDENGNPVSGKQRGDSDGQQVHKLELCNSLKDFEKIIEKHCKVKLNRKMISDVFYYSNRNRNTGSGGVLNPRRTYRETYVPSSIHIIVDVSGSVPVATVNRIVSTLIEVNAFDKKRSRLIQWDTSLKGDDSLMNKTFQLRGFGGTNIARGIEYVSKYVKKKTDKVFIISDFEDDLNAWTRAAKKIKCEKIAICHDANSVNNIDTEFKKQFKTYLINV